MLSGLLVMSVRRSDAFQEAVAGSPVEWIIAKDCQAARQWLNEHPAAAVVVADSTLPDGNWYCVLEWMLNLGSEAALLVVASEGHDVSTILEHGVAGVVRHPFDRRAATVLEGALKREGDTNPPGWPSA